MLRSSGAQTLSATARYGETEAGVLSRPKSQDGKNSGAWRRTLTAQRPRGRGVSFIFVVMFKQLK